MSSGQNLQSSAYRRIRNPLNNKAPRRQTTQSTGARGKATNSSESSRTQSNKKMILLVCLAFFFFGGAPTGATQHPRGRRLLIRRRSHKASRLAARGSQRAAPRYRSTHPERAAQTSAAGRSAAQGAKLRRRVSRAHRTKQSKNRLRESKQKIYFVCVASHDRDQTIIHFLFTL